MVRNIKENLGLAFLYNIILIPVATGLPYFLDMGECDPCSRPPRGVFPCITANVLRLGKFKPRSLSRGP